MNLKRIEQTFNELNRFGYSELGMNRLAYTESERQALKYLIELFQQEGMEVKVDPIGNVIARREGTDPSLPAVMTGSHIDTVYNGGKYDGTLGVVAGLEVVRLLNEQNIKTKHPIELVIFACEESSRFGVATIGSMAMIGQFNERLLQLKDKDGITLQAAIENCGLEIEKITEVHRKKDEVKVFYELHIEQGPVLETEGKQIGIVTGIAAPTRFQLLVEGEAAHSGTTPMHLRKDALLGAAEISLALEQSANQESENGTVATVGTCEVDSGAMNVVPGKVNMSIDIRGICIKSKQRVINELYQTIDKVEKERNLSVSIRKLCDEEPVKIDDEIINSLVESCENLNLSYQKMPSGAGHDAMMMAKLYPTGLIFVPSKNGISHNKKEFTSLEQIGAGVALLKESILQAALVTTDALC